MMRDAFTTEFTRAMRYVLQKHEREMAERSHNDPQTLAIHAANLNLDGAIGQLADHVYDALETMKLEAIEP